MPRLLEPFAARPGEPEFERVVCASRACVSRRVFDQMNDIRDAALRHNPPRHIHAALLYQSGWFMYWIEGPMGPVRETIQRISNDKRHHSQQFLHHSRGRRFLPSPWSMAYMPSTESTEEFGNRVAHLRYLLGQGYQVAPTSALRRLCEPYGLTYESDPSGTESFHRIGVVAANGHASFSLVRWLAEHHGHAVASRRFAGERGLDVANDYVEYLEHDQPVRVIAVARSGINQGLLRAFLCDWHFLLLLFTGVPNLDEAMMDRVLQACAGLPCPPTLLAAAPDASVQAAMEARAIMAGLRYRTLGLTACDEFDNIAYLLGEELYHAGPAEISLWAIADHRMVA